MPDKRSLLKRYWGYDTFRPLQEEIIDSVLGGNDTVALLPTGGGKSLCYQLPTLMMEGLCVVVSPLIALMKDQVQQLNDRQIKAACIVSGMSHESIASVLTNCLYGSVKFLYVSPERLRQHQFIEHFRRMKVCLIAVDEAHCVSQWGYDFRPPYLQISDLRTYQPAVPLIALTATATPAVVADIKLHLSMRQPRHFQSSFARHNLVYSVAHTDNKTVRLIQSVRAVDGCGIVYTRNRRATQTLADQLCHEGISATCYHAGLTSAERDRRQEWWMEGKCRVMVATNAFGMGIDKPDVRFVIHMDVPDSLEAYFQEAGRAGRDGNPAQALLLWSSDDTQRMDRSLEADYPPVNYIRNVYRALCNYCRVPIGSGADSRFDFDLEQFCNTYAFSVREVYGSFRFLELEGLVVLPDREEAYSTLFVPASREEIYRFQVEHIRLGNMLQTLMRLYPGLLTGAVPINERKIASRCGLETKDVVEQLHELHVLHVAEYTPRPSKPQVIFAAARIDEREIRADEQGYGRLGQCALQRLQAVKDYLSNDRDCRSRQLLAYFGETSAVSDCGRCDVCVTKNGSAVATEQDVLVALHGNALSPQDLRTLLEAKGLVIVDDVVRDMLDRGILYLDKNLLLRVS